MLSLIEKELLQAIVDIRTEAPDAVPRLMALERAFSSVAGRTDKQYPQEIRSALMDFARGLEKDISEAAKAGGFFPEFSKSAR